ncbi:MAG TPA: hypothetical protein VFS21_00810 [Roseiflexaceae bacterium]|nr:hypothetical protein [Roseiflexaceae bacterium]
MAEATDTPTRRTRLALPLGLLVGALLLLAWRTSPDGRLHVVALDTPGDALLIQTPAGGYALIDGGSDPAALATAMGRRLPFWRRSLDLVVLTHSGRAHLPGQLAALARYRADNALLGPGEHSGATFTEWRRLLHEQNTPVRTLRVGQRVGLGGATLSVLAAGNGDEGGPILRLDYGATSAVFAHSSSPDDEGALVEAGTLSWVSLVVYPWERDAQNDFIGALRPRWLFLTDGLRTDEPPQQSFAQREAGGTRIFHERTHGTVSWVSDGRMSWVVIEE